MKTNRERFRFAMVIPALLLLVALGLSLRTASFIKHAARTEGQIIAVKRTQKGTTIPTFSFSDAARVTHTNTVSFSSSAFRFKTGDRVTIFYDPSDPERAMIDSFPTLWILPVILAAVGLVLAGFLSGLVVLVSRRENRGRGGADPERYVS